MIEVENLTKSYGGIVAVDGISFDVKKGEILGFLGPNGAGKTSTMRILTCFMPPTSGSAKVAGFDCVESPMEVKKRIGYLPESAPLYKEMKVLEFLNFVAEVKGLKGSDKNIKIDEAMDNTAISEVKNRLIGKLSKGYRQRVGLAQALLNDPPVLILDEPSEGLDPKQIVEIRKVIKNLAEGDRTIILSTHILPEVSILCDRALIIRGGKIIANDSPANLIADGTQMASIELTVSGGSVDAEQFLKTVSGVRSVSLALDAVAGEQKFIIESDGDADIRGTLSQEVVGKGFELVEIKRKLLSLEEVFVDLVEEENNE